MLKHALLFMLASILIAGCGDKKSQQALQPVNPTEQPSPPPLVTLTPETTDYCPPVDQLHKADLNWQSEEGGWQSNNPSFTDQIGSFQGAQWQGVNNGKIICIYKGESSDFPITLQTNRVVARPSGPNWKQLQQPPNNIETEIYNCFSSDTADCPFPKVSYTWTPENDQPADKPIPNS